MLVITRREGEEVFVGDPSKPLGVVRIVSIKGDRVRIAFEFPRHIDVHRREVAEQILHALCNADSEEETPPQPVAEKSTSQNGAVPPQTEPMPATVVR